MKRKLSAIPAADVVGYSSMMENAEAGTLDRLCLGADANRFRVTAGSSEHQSSVMYAAHQSFRICENRLRGLKSVKIVSMMC